MANETFLDASGATKYRKSTGDGTAGSPAVAHNIIDGGTVAATQSGTWTVQPGNTANTTAWLVTGTGGTFPVTGTITANIGSIAGLATETTVESSLTKLGEIEVHLSNLVTTEDTPALTSDIGIMPLAVRRDSLTATAADGDYISLSTDSTGRLYVTSTITGTVAATQSGTWTVTGAGGTFPVTDSGGSLTVDNGGTFAVQVSSALPAGTNNIGDVDIVSGTITTVSTVTNLSQMGGVAITLGAGATTSGTQRVAVASDSTIGLQAGTAIIGQVVQRPDVSNASDGSTVLVPKFARLSTASTGNQAIVGAVVGKKIRVLAMNIMATASTNAVWVNDGTADLHGNTTYKIPLDVTGATGAGGFVLPYCQLGWFETAATNRPLNINLGSANGITAIVTYVEV